MIAFLEQWIDRFPADELGFTKDRVTIEIEKLRPKDCESKTTEQKREKSEQVCRVAALISLNTKGWRRMVLEIETDPKRIRKEVEHFYEELRKQWLMDPGEIVRKIAKKLDCESDDVDSLRLCYLIDGKAKTRLGDSITRPSGNLEDAYLDVLFGLARIHFENIWNEKHELPWLIDDNANFCQGKKPPDLCKRLRHWELRAGNFGEYLGGAIGRAIVATAFSIFDFAVSDEIKKGIGVLFALTARKSAETFMHKEVLKHPMCYPPP